MFQGDFVCINQGYIAFREPTCTINYWNLAPRIQFFKYFFKFQKIIISSFAKDVCWGDFNVINSIIRKQSSMNYLMIGDFHCEFLDDSWQLTTGKLVLKLILEHFVFKRFLSVLCFRCFFQNLHLFNLLRPF